MPARPTAKALVALASIVALVALAITPASAGGPYPFTVTAGVLLGGINDLDLPSTTGACAPKASTTAITTNADGTWTMSGTTSTQFQLGTPPTGQWYQADITFFGSGTWSGASSPYTLTTTAPHHLTFQVRIYRVPSCAKTDLACIITGRAVGSGTFTGTLPAAAAGDSFTFNGTTAGPGGLHLTASSCSAPFSWAHGQVGTISGLAAVL